MPDRFISPCKPPEGLERELLEILAEECAEVIQRVTKALRFGIDEVQPGQPHTNAQRISYEMGDVLAVHKRLIQRGTLRSDDTNEGMRKKYVKLAEYLQNQAAPGAPKKEEGSGG